VPFVPGFSVFSDDVAVEPGEHVVLRWGSRNGITSTLTRITPQGPFAPAGPLPASGTVDLGPFSGTQPASAAYALTVVNGLGTARREVTVQLRRTPKLKIDAIEVVQAVQRPDNSVRLVAQKRTAVRVFVDSGVSDGFDFGVGANIVPHIVGWVVAIPVLLGSGNFGTPVPGVDAQAVPAAIRNRANAAHSVNFELPSALLAGQVVIVAGVAVAGHETDRGGPYTATAAVTVTFSAQPAQMVLPMLVADTLNGIPRPTMQEFTASLLEARKRYPLSELGWAVNPGIDLDARNRFGSSYNLASSVDWGRLLEDIQMMLLLFRSTPTGGVRTAIVPSNDGTRTDAAGNPIPKYALNGFGRTRSAPTLPPALICQAGLTGTYAHEFGHTCGLGHAPCPPPPGTPGTMDCNDPPADIDARLPGRTDEVGFDVVAGTVIENGRGELMSYCGDQSRCSGATRWPSIATWDILFDTLPAR
jgi:hypothetical protein